MNTYQVRKIAPHPRIYVEVPGSKSMTNRALLLAALGQGQTRLSGVLFSRDSQVFLEALESLGFDVVRDEENRRVTIEGLGGRIPNRKGEAYLGSAGTAARFLTAMTAMSSGCFHLDASDQMKNRPMEELLDALEELGARIDYQSQGKNFPFTITGIGRGGEAKVSLNIDRSSQFLSGLLMTAPVCFDALEIHLTGERSARSYVEMTEQMMKQFGHPGVVHLSADSYRVERADYQSQDYIIEPDVSAACYFYAMAAITGGEACVKHMSGDSLQGDMKFLRILEEMGCTRVWRQGQLYLQGPEPGSLKGVTVDMSDFSDQALTLAAIAPYANSPVHIKNVGHIRGQECDRLHAIRINLERMQVKCTEEPEGIIIEPSRPVAAEIETFQDHRVAMAFAVTGVGTEGIVITNPQCCSKTFREYFHVLDKVLDAQQK